MMVEMRRSRFAKCRLMRDVAECFRSEMIERRAVRQSRSARSYVRSAPCDREATTGADISVKQLASPRRILRVPTSNSTNLRTPAIRRKNDRANRRPSELSPQVVRPRPGAYRFPDLFRRTGPPISPSTSNSIGDRLAADEPLVEPCAAQAARRGEGCGVTATGNRARSDGMTSKRGSPSCRRSSASATARVPAGRRAATF